MECTYTLNFSHFLGEHAYAVEERTNANVWNSHLG